MWMPLTNATKETRNPEAERLMAAHGIPIWDEVWVNDRYQVIVRYGSLEGEPGTREGLMHLSIHAHDRGPMRNWRHLQQIKNEVAGEDRTAVEIFPPESKLADSANEYHLWVFPEGVDLPFGFPDSLVSDDRQVEETNDGPTKARQEPWEEGMTTGRNEKCNVGDPVLDQINKPG